MAEQESPLISTVNPPNWEMLKEELLCPLCEYNLRGISEPRCPECGYRFAWQELQDAQAQRHRYIFEDQDRRRFKAFWKTAIGGLLPGEFWRELKPNQKHQPKRVWFYFALVMLVAIAGQGFAIFVQSTVNPRPQGIWIARPFYHASETEVQGILLFATIYWPLATILALMIFRISMDMVRLRPIHVIRCVVYSADCAIWMGIIMAIWAAGVAAMKYAFYPAVVLDEIDFLPIFVCVFSLIFCYRLCRAYELYMRFDRPFATVLASQLIVMLGLIAIVLNARYEPWKSWP